MIPRRFHFIWGTAPPSLNLDFQFVHYLSILSCRRLHSDAEINLHFAYEVQGEWWKKASQLVTLHQVPPLEEIFGRPLLHPAHRADVLRLLILQEQGGIYLDLDTLCVRPFDQLMNEQFVMAKEYEGGLCNAVILAEPKASFLVDWLDAYHSFDGSSWNEHSGQIPSRLATNRAEIKILDHKKFFWPTYSRVEDLRAFFLFPGSRFSSESYSVHLWEAVNRRFLSALTPDLIQSLDSEFGSLARKVLYP